MIYSKKVDDCSFKTKGKTMPENTCDGDGQCGRRIN